MLPVSNTAAAADAKHGDEALKLVELRALKLMGVKAGKNSIKSRGSGDEPRPRLPGIMLDIKGVLSAMGHFIDPLELEGADYHLFATLQGTRRARSAGGLSRGSSACGSGSQADSLDHKYVEAMGLPV